MEHFNHSMYRETKKLVLYVILGLSFFAFPVISQAYIVHYPVSTDELGTRWRFIASSTDPAILDYIVANQQSTQGPYHYYDSEVLIIHNPNCTWADPEWGTYIAIEADFDYSDLYAWQCIAGSMYEITDETNTRIISLDPANASTSPSGNPVYINALAYIAEESSFWDTIKINIWTRDENSILSRLAFTYQTDLYDIHVNTTATSTGFWRYSSTTMLADGNYTIQFSLSNSTLGGLIPNPFGGDTQVLTHQFTVGSSTFLGNLNQTIGQDIEDILQGKTSTSTQVLLDHCKPWSEAGFDIVDCLSGLLIPDKGKMMELFDDFKQGIVYKFPWGYGFRFFALATGSSTSTPPVLGFSIPDDEFFPASLRTKQFSLDPWSALSSTSPLTTADGFGSGNLVDTVMPYWNIVVYGMVVFGVAHRVLGHKHTNKVKNVQET